MSLAQPVCCGGIAMTPTNAGHTPSALTVFMQILRSGFRGRFRKGDAVHIPLVGVTLGLALFFERGRSPTLRAFQAQSWHPWPT